MAVARFKTVTMFILAVFFASIVIQFFTRAIAVNHPNWPMMQGLAANGQA